MDSIYTSLDQLLIRFRDKEPACSSDCNAMLFGLLSFAIHKNCLTKDRQRHIVGEERLSSSTREKSFQGRIEMLRTMESQAPKSPRLHNTGYYDRDRNRCSLRTYISTLIDEVQSRVTGLTLGTLR